MMNSHSSTSLCQYCLVCVSAPHHSDLAPVFLEKKKDQLNLTGTEHNCNKLARNTKERIKNYQRKRRTQQDIEPPMTQRMKEKRKKEQQNSNTKAYRENINAHSHILQNQLKHNVECTETKKRQKEITKKERKKECKRLEKKKGKQKLDYTSNT